jgi:hypothetical protein
MSNTGLIDTIINVDSTEITISKGNFVAHNREDINIEAYIITEAEIILLIKAYIVSNSDSAQSRNIIFIVSLDIS